jgi:hypothetical protein
MMRIGTWIVGLSGAMLLGVWGCGKGETADVTENPTTAPVEVASPGAAPTFGTPSGMGFSTGDAAHGGQGSGAMGYHGTGSMGTSLAITDQHPAPEPAKATTLPVLQAQ